MNLQINKKGFTLIETLVGSAIFLVVALSAYQAFGVLMDAVVASRAKLAATTVANEKFEIVRNLPYDDVGIPGGLPPGKIQRTESVIRDNYSFALLTTIRSEDDPFDGTIGGVPSDSSPADYKLVDLEISCPNCKIFVPLRFTTLVAPHSLETASTNGALFIQVSDAAGIPISSASVHIVNTQTNPDTIINETTDNGGWVRIVDAPPGVNAYNITATKAGYTQDQTYPPGGAAGPDPTKPDATVVLQQVTQANFTIDRISSLNVSTVKELLGSAQDFTVLGAATVTNTGASIVTGELGVSPGTAITGFPPGTLVGGSHAGDAAAAQAQTEAHLAYDTMEAMACPPGNDLTGQDLGTLTLAPGVYCFSSSAQLTGTLVLTGTGPWVFQIGSTLTTASDSHVNMIDPANCGNVFWQVGSSATLGTGTQFAGNILALASITMTTGVNVSGSAIALTGAVTMDTNQIAGCGNGPTTGSSCVALPDIGFSLTGTKIIGAPAVIKYPTQTFTTDGTGNYSIPGLEWDSYGTQLTSSAYDLAGTAPLPSFAINPNEIKTLQLVTVPHLNNAILVSVADSTGTAINGASVQMQKGVFDETKATNSGVCVTPGQVFWNGLGSGTYTLTVSKAGYQTSVSSVDVTVPWQNQNIILTP